eukprot:6052536-Prymnesium_polylepis.1
MHPHRSSRRCSTQLQRAPSAKPLSSSSTWRNSSRERNATRPARANRPDPADSLSKERRWQEDLLHLQDVAAGCQGRRLCGPPAARLDPHEE